MPLIRYLSNKADNHAQHLDWGYDSVSCEYATVRYSDAEVVNFFFSHSMHSTNFVKNDDTISYMIRINEIFISRSHSAFNRVSSNAKQIGNDIRSEFEGHMLHCAGALSSESDRAVAKRRGHHRIYEVQGQRNYRHRWRFSQYEGPRFLLAEWAMDSQKQGSENTVRQSKAADYDLDG